MSKYLRKMLELVEFYEGEDQGRVGLFAREITSPISSLNIGDEVELPVSETDKFEIKKISHEFYDVGDVLKHNIRIQLKRL